MFEQFIEDSLDGIEKKVEKCAVWDGAWTQRGEEIVRGLGTGGTKGFEDCGCYECDGYNTSCPYYMRWSDVYG